MTNTFIALSKQRYGDHTRARSRGKRSGENDQMIHDIGSVKERLQAIGIEPAYGQSMSADMVYEIDPDADHFCCMCKRQISLEQLQTSDSMCHVCYEEHRTEYPVGTVVIEDNEGVANIVVTKEDRTVNTYGPLVSFNHTDTSSVALNFAKVEDGPNLSVYRSVNGELIPVYRDEV